MKLDGRGHRLFFQGRRDEKGRFCDISMSRESLVGSRKYGTKGSSEKEKRKRGDHFISGRGKFESEMGLLRRV